MDKAYALQIQNVLENLLDQLQIPYSSPEYDQALHNACLQGAKERGISLEGPVHIGPYLPVGVSISSNGYSHLPDPLTRVYIALYTAALVAVEDVCGNDIDLLKAFCHRYLKSIPHGHIIMDTYDLILRELPDHFDIVVADMMIQSNMDFIVANVLEYEMQHRLVSPSATGFPVFLRNLSGASKIYSLLAYPKNMPVRSYIEGIPASMTYVNFVNDIFSFYKEELVHETVNCISNIARCTKRTKLDVLKYLARESVEAHKEVLAVLRDDEAALEAFKAFCRGYVYFHTSSTRYKVPHLWKMAREEEQCAVSAPQGKHEQHLLPSLTPRIKILGMLVVLVMITSFTLFNQFGSSGHWSRHVLAIPVSF